MSDLPHTGNMPADRYGYFSSMISLWLDRERQDRTDPLPPDGRFDDLVVGAGLTGLTTGLLLARAGRRVGVVDTGAVGGLTTGHTTAKATVLQGTKLSRMAAHRSHDVLRAYLEANQEGQQWLRRFCDDHGVAVQERDAVTFAANHDEVHAVRAEHDLGRSLGLPLRWVDALDVPFPSYGATLLAEQVQFDPIDVVDALADQLRAHGGTIHPYHHVRDVGAAGGAGEGSVVTLDDGRELCADTVVLATGTPILDRGLSFARLEPNRSYLLAFRDAEPPEGMYISAGRPTRSLRDVPTPDGPVLLVGGNGHVVGRTASEERMVRELRSWAKGWFPAAMETHAWSAQDYTAAGGGVPQVGTLPLTGGAVHYATGYDKWGMTNAVAAALTLAGEILGDRPRWSGPFRAPLPDPRDLPALLSLNARVGLAAVRSAAAGLSRRVPESTASGQGSVGRAGLRPVAQSSGPEEGSCRLSAICTHLGGTLHWNDAEQTWDCPLHGSRFDRRGAVIEGPAVRPLQPVDPRAGEED